MSFHSTVARSPRRVWLILTALATLGWGACSDSDRGRGADTLADLGIDDGASQGESRSKLIKAGEAADLTLKTGARLSIPEGAADDDVEVSMKRPRDEEALPLLKMVTPEYKAVSAPYVVTPHGKRFSKEVELSLPVGKGKADRLEVAFLDDEDDTSWEIHGKPKLDDDGSAKVALKHFSVYVLLERIDDEPELDAGTATNDGGLDGEVDVAPDTGAVADAGPDATQTDGGFAERLSARLSECNLLSQPGKLSDELSLDTAEQRCAASCLFDAHCDDVMAEVCEGTTSPTSAYTSCVLKCFSFSIVECVTVVGTTNIVASCDGFAQCMDGADEANCPDSAFFTCVDSSAGRVPIGTRCDGNPDCTDGSDEQSCPPGTQFTCDSGEVVAATYECDNELDCADGSDEARCPKFQCKDGAQLVPTAVVCDLTRDCSDGSDEDQGCLKLTCEPRAEPAIDL